MNLQYSEIDRWWLWNRNDDDPLRSWQDNGSEAATESGVASGGDVIGDI